MGPLKAASELNKIHRHMSSCLYQLRLVAVLRPDRRGEVQLGGAVHQEPPERSPVCRHHTRLQSHLGRSRPGEPAQVPLPGHPQRRGLRTAVQQRAQQRHEHIKTFLFGSLSVCVRVLGSGW